MDNLAPVLALADELEPQLEPKLLLVLLVLLLVLLVLLLVLLPSPCGSVSRQGGQAYTNIVSHRLVYYSRHVWPLLLAHTTACTITLLRYCSYYISRNMTLAPGPD